MAINVNGYNATFQEFVNFAKLKDVMGGDNAIARISTGVNIAEGSLAGRKITASDTDSVRGFFKWFRSDDDKAKNNEVRRLFRDAVIDMFGGESKIPAAVKKAMILADYDKGMSAFANAAKDYANFVIRDYMQPEKANNFSDNIHDTMVADAHRATFIFNGKAYQETPAAELIPVFKSLVPDPAKQKALSSWLNQLCTTTFMSPSMGVPYGETGVNAIKLKGAGALANRDMTAGVFKSSLLDTYGHDIVHELQVSPDGKTATITQTITADLSSPGSQMNKKISFGQVTLSQRLVVDLAAEMPTVTDFQISQKIDW